MFAFSVTLYDVKNNNFMMSAILGTRYAVIPQFAVWLGWHSVEKTLNLNTLLTFFDSLLMNDNVI